MFLSFYISRSLILINIIFILNIIIPINLMSSENKKDCLTDKKVLPSTLSKKNNIFLEFVNLFSSPLEKDDNDNDDKENKVNPPSIDIVEFVSKLADIDSETFNYKNVIELNKYLHSKLNSKKMNENRRFRYAHFLDNIINNQFQANNCLREAVANAIDSYYHTHSLKTDLHKDRIVNITTGIDSVRIEDHGVGMSLNDITTHLLSPNSSGKGVVGEGHSEKKTIGQFGQGFFSLLGMLNGDDNAKIVIETKKQGQSAYRVTIFNNNNNKDKSKNKSKIALTIEEISKNNIGTAITVSSKKLPKSEEQKDLYQKYFKYNTNAQIILHQENNKSSPPSTINSLETIQKNTLQLTAVTVFDKISKENYIKKEYPLSLIKSDLAEDGHGVVNININGVLIKQIPVEGINVLKELTLNFPPETPLTTGRDQIDFNNKTNIEVFKHILIQLRENKQWSALNTLVPLLNKSYFDKNLLENIGFNKNLIKDNENNIFFIPAVEELVNVGVQNWKTYSKDRETVLINPIFLDNLNHFHSNQEYQQSTFKVFEIPKNQENNTKIPILYEHNGINHLIVENKTLDSESNREILNQWSKLWPKEKQFHLFTPSPPIVTSSSNTITSNKKSSSVNLSSTLESNILKSFDQFTINSSNQSNFEFYKNRYQRLFTYSIQANEKDEKVKWDAFIDNLAKFHLIKKGKYDCEDLTSEYLLDKLKNYSFAPEVLPDKKEEQEILSDLLKIDSCIVNLEKFNLGEKICSLFYAHQANIIKKKNKQILDHCNQDAIEKFEKLITTFSSELSDDTSNFWIMIAARRVKLTDVTYLEDLLSKTPIQYHKVISSNIEQILAHRDLILSLASSNDEQEKKEWSLILHLLKNEQNESSRNAILTNLDLIFKLIKSDPQFADKILQHTKPITEVFRFIYRLTKNMNNDSIKQRIQKNAFESIKDLLELLENKEIDEPNFKINDITNFSFTYVTNNDKIFNRLNKEGIVNNINLPIIMSILFGQNKITYQSKEFSYKSKNIEYPQKSGEWINVAEDPEVQKIIAKKSTTKKPGQKSKVDTQYILACKQNFKKFTWVNELIKNSKEAGAKNIDINIHTNDEGEIFYEIIDDGKGMSTKDLPYLYIPGYTNKPPKDDDKNFGWGFFTIFAEAKELVVTTRKENESTEELWLRKVDNSDDRVMEMKKKKLNKKIEHLKHKKNFTQIVIKGQKKSSMLDPILLFSHLLGNETKDININFNGESIKEWKDKMHKESKLVQSQSFQTKIGDNGYLDKIEVFVDEREGGVLYRGNKIDKDLNDCYKVIPDKILNVFNKLNRNITINIEGTLAQNTNRNDFLDASKLDPYIKLACIKGAWKALASILFVEDKSKTKISKDDLKDIPYDFFYKLSFHSARNNSKVDTEVLEELNNNGSIKLKNDIPSLVEKIQKSSANDNYFFQILKELNIPTINDKFALSLWSAKEKVRHYLIKKKIININGEYLNVSNIKKINLNELSKEIPPTLLNVFETNLNQNIELINYQSEQHKKNNHNKDDKEKNHDDKLSIMDFDINSNERDIATILAPLDDSYKNKHAIATMKLMKKLSEDLLAKLQTDNISSNKNKIDIKFYYNVDGSMAHAIQSGETISFNLASSSLFKAFTNFYYKNENIINDLTIKSLQEFDAQTYARLVECLTHEFTHILEQSGSETHDELFYRKQRKLIVQYLY
ncbi:MAG: ATP-binding protein [Oligoflexia bacterium]|nr:ATP-binding protein [Oligoflexia bacterium]